MVTTQIGEMMDAYRQLAVIPTLSSAAINSCLADDHKKVIQTQWVQRDLLRMEKIKSMKRYIISPSPTGISLSYSVPVLPNGNEIWHQESPSGKLTGIVREVKDKKGEKEQLIEVWNGFRMVRSVDIKVHDKHGKIYEDDSTFGSFQWSHKGDKILYVAEKKLPKMAGYFAEAKPNEDETKAKETTKGEEHVHREEWGEQLVGKHAPVLCILDVNDGSITVLDSVPETITPGQAVWAPEDTGIVYVGWQNTPWRLGLIYCIQRRSQIFYLDLTTGASTALSAADRAVRCPQFSPDGSCLAYLDCRDHGPHYQNSRLLVMDWTSRQSKVVVDIKTEDPKFPGIYDGLPSRCWCSDNRRLILSSPAHSLRKVFLVDTSSKAVQSIQPSFHKGSCSVLDVSDDIVVAVCSSPDESHSLVVGKVPEAGREADMEWECLEHCEKAEGISWEIVTHTAPSTQSSPAAPLEYESILLLPPTKDGEKPPLIVFPHGGPHSVFTADFMVYPACFCQCGFAVLMVNYRGSIGFGPESVDCLPGKVGDQDVKDVQRAADEVVAKGLADGNRLLVFGGSHGGFLTTHLIGQYPKTYKAACCRNPVINLATMFGTTDIPDWVFVEAGLDFSHTSQLNPEVLKELWLRSPIRYVDQVETPLMLMVGKDDLRVPPSQAREFNRALLARGKTVRMLEYPENAHPISSVKAESDAIINILLWFCERLR